MSYKVNPAVFGNAFAVPVDVADKYLKLATPTQLKVLLYFMRNISDNIDSSNIASALALPESEVLDALTFWAQCNILNSETKPEPTPKNIVITSELPTRSDVIRRGLEDERLAFLLREAQVKFGRNLKQNESQLLVSLYDDCGMDISVILLLLQYASHEGRFNVSFIKKVAAAWLKSGVETVAEAEALITENAKQKLAWQVIERVFGIEKRNPSERELELCNLWVNEWQMSSEMLKAAYDACVDSKTKLSMPYVSKILESWYKAGYKKPDDITNGKKSENSKKQNTKNDFAGYNLDLYEKMLNEKINRKD